MNTRLRIDFTDSKRDACSRLRLSRARLYIKEHSRLPWQPSTPPPRVSTAIRPELQPVYSGGRSQEHAPIQCAASPHNPSTAQARLAAC